MFFSVIVSAWASSSYPPALEDELDMPCAPTCTICHESNAGGQGTVVQEFGLAMMGHELTGGSDIPALQAALGGMHTDAIDSDADGTLDADELAAGSDPNPGGLPFCDVVVPAYGCFGGSGGAAAGMGLTSLFGLMALRRRARRPR